MQSLEGKVSNIFILSRGLVSAQPNGIQRLDEDVTAYAVGSAARSSPAAFRKLAAAGKTIILE